MTEERKPLKPLTEEVNDIDATSPQSIKLQLLELLKSADIEEHDIKEHIKNVSELDIDYTMINNKRESQLNSSYDKQILLEEAEIINKLHSWIEKKGKPAIKKINELQMKTDEYEQMNMNYKLELKTLNDELNKINKEKYDLQRKYNELNNNHKELQQTMKTLKLSHDHHEEVHTEYHDQNEQHTDKLKQFETEIDELNKVNNDLKIEIENLTKLNTQYMEQNSSLKTKIETKDEQIGELTTDRNEWENRAQTTQQDLLQRLQQINKLNTENANYKQQIELIQSNKQPSGDMLSNAKTLRNVFDGIGTDSSGDLLLDQQNKINTDGFYQQSETNILTQTGIYGQSTTNIIGQSTATIVEKISGHQSRDSIDNNKENIFEIQRLKKQLKDERASHKEEMESLTFKLEEQIKMKIVNELDGKYKDEIKRLNEENQQLTEQNNQQQSGGCNGCSVL